MRDPIPLSDRRARLAWRLYFMRAESALAATPKATRQELLVDLRSYIGELMANDAESITERARLKSALQRVGDPKHFLSPLLSASAEDGVHNRIGAVIRAGLYYATRVIVLCALALGVLIVIASSFALLLSALASLLDPERYGVFLVGESSLRIGGSADLAPGAYRQLLSPIFAVPLAVMSAAALFWSALVARALVLRLVAVAFSAGARFLL